MKKTENDFPHAFAFSTALEPGGEDYKSVWRMAKAIENAKNPFSFSSGSAKAELKKIRASMPTWCFDLIEELLNPKEQGLMVWRSTIDAHTGERAPQRQAAALKCACRVLSWAWTRYDVGA